ncbi:MAG: prenyltransferase [Thermoplasmata archaeon]|nr:MAG: prenyltransferase [Thermoplasmata archaeon]
MEGRDLKAILKLGRFPFVIGGLLLYLFGYMLAVSAGSEIDLTRFIFGYAVLFCAHLSVSYSNDLFDVETDAHTTATPISGGSKVLVERPDLIPVARSIALGLILISLALGALFVLTYDMHPAFFGLVLLGNLLGYYYSAPPVRLSHRGLGEAATTVTIGLLVPAMGYFVASGGLDGAFLVFVPAVLLYGIVFIIVVQLPDMEGDRLGGKPSIIVKRGRRFGYRVAAGAAALASLYFLVLGIVAPGASTIDLWVAFLCSLVPTGFAFAAAIVGDLRFEGAARSSTAVMGSLFLFNILFNAYMILGV